MRTYHTKLTDIKRKWHLFDAKDFVLGRLSTQASHLLMGKQKPNYSTNVDSGDYVVVINAEKVKLTGKKSLQKVYRSHSGYPGGFKEISFEKMLNDHPERIIENAVSGMLPDNRLKKNRMSRLKAVKGPENPYESKFKSL